MGTFTLGGFGIYDPPAVEDAKFPAYNFFDMHTGAARPGMGRVLMTRDDFNAMMTATPTGLVTLILQAGPDGIDPDPTGAGLVLPVLVAGASPVDVEVTDSGAGAVVGGMVSVTIYDRRATLTTPTTKFYNVQSAAMVGGGATTSFFQSTLVATTPPTRWSWSAMAADLTVALGYNNWPAYDPRNVMFDATPYHRVVDEIASRLFCVVGYDGAALTMVDPGTAAAANTALAAAAAAFMVDGEATLRNVQRLPGAVVVNFIAAPTAADPFATPSYSKTVTNATGNPSLTQTLTVGCFAYDGSNSAELDTVAADMAARWLAFASVPIKEAAYGGIWAFKPDGAIRGIRWAFDRTGPRTFVRYNDVRDFNPAADIRRALDILTNQLVEGLGGTRVGMTTGGTRLVMTPTPAGAGAMGVYLTQNGGANGDDGTTGGALAYPTYTYDVYADAAKTRLLATAASVVAHRFLQINVTPATCGLWIPSTATLMTVFDEYPSRGDCP